mmetsp:Transcript_17672/g.46003  ORF Transcript_17672/g.46003 Transcript_17672/m.46003 type:complete len:284 (-) Transcript_17672:323-1174(-)
MLYPLLLLLLLSAKQPEVRAVAHGLRADVGHDLAEQLTGRLGGAVLCAAGHENAADAVFESFLCGNVVALRSGRAVAGRHHSEALEAGILEVAASNSTARASFGQLLAGDCSSDVAQPRADGGAVAHRQRQLVAAGHGVHGLIVGQAGARDEGQESHAAGLAGGGREPPAVDGAAHRLVIPGAHVLPRASAGQVDEDRLVPRLDVGALFILVVGRQCSQALGAGGVEADQVVGGVAAGADGVELIAAHAHLPAVEVQRAQRAAAHEAAVPLAMRFAARATHRR